MALCNKTCLVGQTLNKELCQCMSSKKRKNTVPRGNISPFLNPKNPSLKKGGTMKIKKKK